MALTDKLINIADAIRGKTGKTDLLTLEQMATEIGEISGGGIEYVNDNATSIADNAYRGMPLKSVDFPKVATIGGSAFRDCAELAAVNFPVATTVGANAFRSTALTTVDLPNATSIEQSAFYACSALTTLILRRADAGCVFSRISALSGTPILENEGHIYVPAAVIDSYIEWWTGNGANPDVFRALEDYTVDGTTTGALGKVVNFVNYTISGANLATIKIGDKEVTYEHETPVRAVLGTDGEFTVTCAQACVVLVKNGEDYDRVTAELVEGNTYKFKVVPEEGMEIVVALKGDITLDGFTNSEDAARINRSLLAPDHKRYKALNKIEFALADVNADECVDVTDETIVTNSLAGPNDENYSPLTWDVD